MRKLILCLGLICLINAAPLLHQLHEYTFEQYVSDFNKSYTKGSEEYQKR